MVLEDIVIPESMECHPARMLIVGFIYAIIGIFLGYFVFGKYASISGIFITTIPLVLIVYRTIRYEEEKCVQITKELPLLKEHTRAMLLFIYLFLGMAFAYSVCFTILPDNMVKTIFEAQIETVTSVRGGMSSVGQFTGTEGRLGMILANNFKVLAFCILFSFLYGSGAIFILAWNASVIGVAMGDIVRTGLQGIADYTNIDFFYNYFQAFPMSLTYLIHGIPEVAAYFFAALGGGIISVGMARYQRHHHSNENVRHIIFDSLDLLILSVLILVAAALVEVYVTPVVF